MGLKRFTQAEQEPDQQDDRVVLNHEAASEGRNHIGYDRLDGVGVLGCDTDGALIFMVLLVEEPVESGSVESAVRPVEEKLVEHVAYAVRHEKSSPIRQSVC